MNDLARMVAAIGSCFICTSCVTYSGVARAPDGQLYISGGTNYFVYTSAWVRRCDVDGQKLNCVELSESPATSSGAAASDSGATSAPSSAETSTTETTAAEVAPPPPPTAKPAKHR